jgi:hypothetical protein
VTDAACLMCGDPAPEPLTGTRRYCSVVCRRNRENEVRRLLRRLAEIDADREGIDREAAWAASGQYPHLHPDPAGHARKVAANEQTRTAVTDRLRALHAPTAR